MNSLYIVTGKDTDTNEKFEYEEPTIQKALEIYNQLKDADDITGLIILEYNLITKQYHMISIND